MIRALDGAVEYIVGRDVHERNSAGGGDDREVARPQCVDRVRLGSARLRAVDVVECAGIDHQRRTVKRHGIADRVEPRNVERRMIERDQLMRGEWTRKTSAELSRSASDE